MTIATTIDYGRSHLDVDLDGASERLGVILDAKDGKTGGDTTDEGKYPDYEYDTSQKPTLEVYRHRDGASLTTVYAKAFIVRDDTDTGGEYHDTSTGSKTADVVAEADIGLMANVGPGDRVQFDRFIDEGGTYRLVVSFGAGSTSQEAEDNARDIDSVDTGATSNEWHADSDRNVAKGGDQNVSVNDHAGGGFRRTVVVNSIATDVHEQAYTDQPTLSWSIDTANAKGIHSPRSLAYSPINEDTGTVHIDAYGSTASDGTGSGGYNVDTRLPVDPAPMRAAVGVNGELRPVGSAEKSGLAAVDTYSDADAWVTFQADGHASELETRSRYAGFNREPHAGSPDLTLPSDWSHAPVREEKWGSGFEARNDGGWMEATTPSLVLDSDVCLFMVVRVGDAAPASEWQFLTISDPDSGNYVRLALNANGEIRYNDDGGSAVTSSDSLVNTSTNIDRLVPVSLERVDNGDGTADLTVRAYDPDGTVNVEITVSNRSLPGQSGSSDPELYVAAGPNGQNNWDPDHASDVAGVHELRIWGDQDPQPGLATLDQMADKTDTTHDHALEGNETLAYFLDFEVVERVWEPSTVPGTQRRAGHRVDVDTVTRNANGEDAAAGTTLYNRLEPVNIDVSFLDAFGNTVAPDGTQLAVVDTNGSAEHTTSPQDAAPYNMDHQTGSTDEASYDETGVEKVLRFVGGHYGTHDPTFTYDGTDQPRQLLYHLSRKYLLGSTGNSRDVSTPHGLYNRDETVDFGTDEALFYARGDALETDKASLQVEIHDGLPTSAGTDGSTDADTVEQTVSADTDDSGNLTADGGGNLTFTIGTDANAVSDVPLADEKTSGQPKHVRVVDDGNASDDSDHEYSVSDALGLGSSSTTNDAAMATVETAGGDAATLFNVDETIQYAYHVSYARGTVYDKDVTSTVQDIAEVTEDTQTLTPDANGKVAASYTAENRDAHTSSRIGADKQVKVSQGGNTRTSTSGVWSLTDLLVIGTTQGSPNGQVLAQDPDGEDETVFNLGETIDLAYWVSYARGDPYVDPSDGSPKSLTARVEDDQNAAEDSRSLTTEADTGKLAYTYTVAQGDKATSDATGSPKHVHVTGPNGNNETARPGDLSGADVVEDWGISDLLTIDTVHTQRGTSETTDNSPAGALLREFVITGDRMTSKALVHNARGEPHAGATVTQERLSDDGSSVVESHSSQDTTGTGWPDQFYTWSHPEYEADYTLRTRASDDAGNATTSDTSVTITWVASQSGNKFALLSTQLLGDAGDTMRVWCSFGQLNDAGDAIEWADGPGLSVSTSPEPHIEIYEFSDTEPRQVVEAATAMTPKSGQPAGGADWYFDVTLGERRTYQINVWGRLGNVPINGQFQVKREGGEASVTDLGATPAGINHVAEAGQAGGDVDEAVVTDKSLDSTASAKTTANQQLGGERGSDNAETSVTRIGEDPDKYAVGDEVALPAFGITGTIREVRPKDEGVELVLGDVSTAQTAQAETVRRVEKAER